MLDGVPLPPLHIFISHSSFISTLHLHASICFSRTATRPTTLRGPFKRSPFHHRDPLINSTFAALPRKSECHQFRRRPGWRATAQEIAKNDWHSILCNLAAKRNFSIFGNRQIAASPFYHNLPLCASGTCTRDSRNYNSFSSTSIVIEGYATA